MPALSVLVPVRDALPWLRSALDSLWRQTFRDFEVIAVDDGSSDGSGDELERAAAREPRLRVIHTPPRGLPAALNAGLALARSRLVARHDADDLCHRRRFELQRDFLREHPRVAVVGSRVRLFPATMVGVGMRRWVAWHNALLTHQAMAAEMLIDSPLAHGSAMIRARWLERVGGWEDHGWAEDLDLWLRLIEAGARLAKLPQVLYGWRQHRSSATRRDPRYAAERFLGLRRAALERGLLRGAPSVTLVGVGASLERWRAELAPGRHVRLYEARRPSLHGVANFVPPVVLIFVAPTARERWRSFLCSSGMAEGRDFIFVA